MLQQINIPKRPKQQKTSNYQQLVGGLAGFGAGVVALVFAYYLRASTSLTVLITAISAIGPYIVIGQKLYLRRIINEKKYCLVNRENISPQKCRSFKPGSFGRCENTRVDGRCACEVGWADRIPKKYQ